MRFRNNTCIILIFLALFFIFIPNAYAALIIPYQEMPIVIILIITVATIMNIIIEFIVVYVFLKSRDLDKKDVFISVSLVNFVIFPPTQTIAYFLTLFNIELYVFYVFIFGFLMVLLEWLLYRLEF
ncbi:MAG: hypothetical protein ACFFAN_16560, partial [Promethearchaeota archaeon]